MVINKKGFAVSSMLYGLIFSTIAIFYLIIAIVSNRYQTNSNFVDMVRGELNGSPNALKNFTYTGAIQSFVVPETGIYKLEVWGASGGSLFQNGTTILDNYQGGRGGYSSGNITLEKGQVIYVGVGEKGVGANASGKSFEETFNGGGGVNNDSSSKNIVASGGGATHIAIGTNRGELANYENHKSEILIVAGGGGGAKEQEEHTEATRWGSGGAGGGFQGIGASSSNGSLTTYTTISSLAGTKTSGYLFGKGETGSSQSGGGGGYYGGFSGNNNGVSYAGAGSGGSGYVSNLLTSSKTIAGNQLVPTYSGKGTMYGNSGHGYAQITLVKKVESDFEISYFHGLTVDDLYKKDSFARQKVQEIKDAGFTLIPLSSKCYYPGNSNCPDYNEPITTIENCSTESELANGCVIDYYTHESLELLAEYGIKVILMNFRIINSYVDGYTESSLRSLVDTYGSYENIVGWDIDDEPFINEFENRAKIVNYLNTIDPERKAHINLLPNYSDRFYTLDDLDTNTIGRKVKYQNEYLWDFINDTNISFISVDHYPNFMYTPINPEIQSPKNLYYSNLLDVLSIYKIRKLKGDDLIPINIVESTNHKIGIYDIQADENDIIYQVNTNLAFGMKRISYFTYADFQGNDSAMLDKDKNITAKYNIVKNINKWAYNLGNELYNKEIKNIYGLNENFIYEDGFATLSTTSSNFLDKYLCNSSGSCDNTYRNSELESNLSTYMSEYNNSSYINTLGRINVYKTDTTNNSTGIITFFDDNSFMLVNTNLESNTQFQFYHGAMSPLTSFEYFDYYQNNWVQINSDTIEIKGIKIIPILNSVYLEPGYSLLLRRSE